MTGYAIRRILWIAPVLLVIATVTFFIMKAVPGGPFTYDKSRPPAQEAALNEKYGFDEPVWQQYVTYMENLLQGDLGISYFHGNPPVRDVIQDKAFVSLQIGFLSLVMALTIGMTFGVLSALQHNGVLDYGGVLFATLGASIPHFVLAAFLVIIFAVNLNWFGTLGWGGPKDWSEVLDPSAYDWRNMVLPVVALAMLPAAYIARVTRASMLEVLNQDYIRTARAKGLREYRVVVRHTVKNALIPVLTVIGPIAAILVSGSFIIESMFGIPGIGKESIAAIQSRDYGLIMGTTLFFAMIVAFANLIVDLLYAVVDPRIRYR